MAAMELRMIGNIIQPPDLTNSHTVTVPSKKCATLPYRFAIKTRRPDDLMPHSPIPRSMVFQRQKRRC